MSMDAGGVNLSVFIGKGYFILNENVSWMKCHCILGLKYRMKLKNPNF